MRLGDTFELRLLQGQGASLALEAHNGDWERPFGERTRFDGLGSLEGAFDDGEANFFVLLHYIESIK